MKETPTINHAGLELLLRFESFSPVIYTDPVGVETIGYGHTTKPLPHTVTQEEALDLLYEDINEAISAVAKFTMVPLNDNQFSALIAFVFNVGRGNFASSTLLRRLNEHDYEAAAQEFLKWDGKPGKKLRGLTRRRGAEEQLFRTPPQKEYMISSHSTEHPLFNQLTPGTQVIMLEPVHRMIYPEDTHEETLPS